MKTKELTLCGVLIALSFVGSNIKVMGSIAFDSLPAFLGTLILGPVYGAVIGAVGHMFSSLLSGFPLSLPVHLIVAGVMAITMVAFYFSFSVLSDKVNLGIALIGAGTVGVLVNGPVAIAMFWPLLTPVMGVAGLLAMLPVLSIVACANIVVGFVLYFALVRAKIVKGSLK